MSEVGKKIELEPISPFISKVAIRGKTNITIEVYESHEQKNGTMSEWKFVRYEHIPIAHIQQITRELLSGE